MAKFQRSYKAVRHGDRLWYLEPVGIDGQHLWTGGASEGPFENQSDAETYAKESGWNIVRGNRRAVAS